MATKAELEAQLAVLGAFDTETRALQTVVNALKTLRPSWGSLTEAHKERMLRVLIHAGERSGVSLYSE